MNKKTHKAKKGKSKKGESKKKTAKNSETIIALSKVGVRFVVGQIFSNFAKWLWEF